jgi:hypothetical protein
MVNNKLIIISSNFGATSFMTQDKDFLNIHCDVNLVFTKLRHSGQNNCNREDLHRRASPFFADFKAIEVLKNHPKKVKNQKLRWTVLEEKQNPESLHFLPIPIGHKHLIQHPSEYSEITAKYVC